MGSTIVRRKATDSEETFICLNCQSPMFEDNYHTYFRKIESKRPQEEVLYIYMCRHCGNLLFYSVSLTATRYGITIRKMNDLLSIFFSMYFYLEDSLSSNIPYMEKRMEELEAKCRRGKRLSIKETIELLKCILETYVFDEDFKSQLKKEIVRIENEYKIYEEKRKAIIVTCTFLPLVVLLMIYSKFFLWRIS